MPGKAKVLLEFGCGDEGQLDPPRRCGWSPVFPARWDPRTRSHLEPPKRTGPVYVNEYKALGRERAPGVTIGVTKGLITLRFALWRHIAQCRTIASPTLA